MTFRLSNSIRYAISRVADWSLSSCAKSRLTVSKSKPILQVRKVAVETSPTWQSHADVPYDTELSLPFLIEFR